MGGVQKARTSALHFNFTPLRRCSSQPNANNVAVVHEIDHCKKVTYAFLCSQAGEAHFFRFERSTSPSRDRNSLITAGGLSSSIIITQELQDSLKTSRRTTITNEIALPATTCEPLFAASNHGESLMIMESNNLFGAYLMTALHIAVRTLAASLAYLSKWLGAWNETGGRPLSEAHHRANGDDDKFIYL